MTTCKRVRELRVRCERCDGRALRRVEEAREAREDLVGDGPHDDVGDGLGGRATRNEGRVREVAGLHEGTRPECDGLESGSLVSRVHGGGDVRVRVGQPVEERVGPTGRESGQPDQFLFTHGHA